MRGKRQTKAPFCCAYCGKPARKAIETVSNPYRRRDEESARRAWVYQGNKKLIRYRRVQMHGECEVNYEAHVWDGETWKLTYGKFCTLNCSHYFAVAAFDAGYRIVGQK